MPRDFMRVFNANRSAARMGIGSSVRSLGIGRAEEFSLGALRRPAAGKQSVTVGRLGFAVMHVQTSAMVRAEWRHHIASHFSLFGALPF
jgi:hypothetical protein